MKKEGSIYVLLLNNDLIYIGKTSGEPVVRFQNHLNCITYPEVIPISQKIYSPKFRDTQTKIYNYIRNNIRKGSNLIEMKIIDQIEKHLGDWEKYYFYEYIKKGYNLQNSCKVFNKIQKTTQTLDIELLRRYGIMKCEEILKQRNIQSQKREYDTISVVLEG